MPEAGECGRHFSMTLQSRFLTSVFSAPQPADGPPFLRRPPPSPLSSSPASPTNSASPSILLHFLTTNILQRVAGCQQSARPPALPPPARPAHVSPQMPFHPSSIWA
mmetsp:Transcript_35631/g.100881  ORF Transcript_35631/g.100881 Transcript_35631/m.100881 type:complete len:107 (+) Transcript_35631:1738-2058(+)